MNWLLSSGLSRFLRSFLLFLRRAPWGAPAEWTESDARALASFLATSAGAKLAASMRSEIAAANERAAMSKGNPFECGWACGYRGLFAWFESLSAEAPAVSGAQTEDPFAAAENLEHLAA